MTPATPPVLPFTGERFTPECVREIWYEHLHRYAWAAGFARGKRVLDAACGEGYGSALLARAGAQVLGLDIDPASVAHAQARYAGQQGLQFAQADVTALDQLADASFELIVSFETLEHVQAQERMLAGFRRLLKPDGMLLLSSPDKHNYSDARGYHNEFHVRELYREEFDALLAAHFPAQRVYAQKLVFGSLLWDPAHAPTRAGAATLAADGLLLPEPAWQALYWIAACACDPALLPPAGAMHLFGDTAESVYTHYNDEIRRHIAAGQRLLAQDREIGELRLRIAELSAQLADASMKTREGMP